MLSFFLKRFLSLESIKYVIVGFFTTLLNFLLFIVLNFLFENSITNFRYNWLIAEALAFILSVLFDFFMDKYIVFRKTDTKIIETFKELINFMIMRVVSEILNVVGMFIFINKLKINTYVSKSILCIVVVILNYLFSKFIIFNKNNND